MPKIAHKITALLLIFILFAVQLAAELAHQHPTPNARQPLKSFTQQQVQIAGLNLCRVQPLCLACFFSNANQSLPPVLTVIVNFTQIAAVAPPPQYFFQQFFSISSQNRAPPSGVRV